MYRYDNYKLKEKQDPAKWNESRPRFQGKNGPTKYMQTWKPTKADCSPKGKNMNRKHANTCTQKNGKKRKQHGAPKLNAKITNKQKNGPTKYIQTWKPTVVPREKTRTQNMQTRVPKKNGIKRKQHAAPKLNAKITNKQRINYPKQDE